MTEVYLTFTVVALAPLIVAAFFIMLKGEKREEC